MDGKFSGILSTEGTKLQGCCEPPGCGQTAPVKSFHDRDAVLRRFDAMMRLFDRIVGVQAMGDPAGPPISDGGLPACPQANGEYTLRCVRTNEGCQVTWELV